MGGGGGLVWMKGQVDDGRRGILGWGKGLAIAIIRYFKHFIFDTTSPDPGFLSFKGAASRLCLKSQPTLFKFIVCFPC